MKGSAVDLSVRIESDVNEVIDIVLVDQIRIVGLGGDVEDAVIVRGIGSRGLAGDQIVDNGDEDLGQLVGVEEGRHGLLAGKNVLDSRKLRVLTGHDGIGVGVGAVAHGLERGDDAQREAVGRDQDGIQVG